MLTEKFGARVRVKQSKLNDLAAKVYRQHLKGKAHPLAGFDAATKIEIRRILQSRFRIDL